MTKQGRKKTPTAVLKLRGSWRAKERTGEPQPQGSIGECPDWLGEHGSAKWREVVSVLEPMGLATDADRDALTCYCEAWQDFRDAMDAIEKHGAEIVSSKGAFYTNPAVHRKQSALARLCKWSDKFGLSPSARADLHAVPREEKSSKSKFFKKQA